MVTKAGKRAFVPADRTPALEVLRDDVTSRECLRRFSDPHRRKAAYRMTTSQLSAF